MVTNRAVRPRVLRSPETRATKNRGEPIELDLPKVGA